VEALASRLAATVVLSRILTRGTTHIRQAGTATGDTRSPCSGVHRPLRIALSRWPHVCVHSHEHVNYRSLNSGSQTAVCACCCSYEILTAWCRLSLQLSILEEIQYYTDVKGPPLVPTRSMLYPVHIFTICLSKILSEVIVPPNTCPSSHPFVYLKH
jgi:hypothetical protein